MQKVFIEDDGSVTPLSELAAELAKANGWKSYRVDGDAIYFETDGGAQHRVDTSGWAQTLEDGEWIDDDELNVNWDEDFDAWSNHVWAKDEYGRTVMIHD